MKLLPLSITVRVSANLKASALLLDVSVELKHFVKGRRNSPASHEGSIFFNSASQKIMTKNEMQNGLSNNENRYHNQEPPKSTFIQLTQDPSQEQDVIKTRCKSIKASRYSLLAQFLSKVKPSYNNSSEFMKLYRWPIYLYL